jgi:hypothetical protein
VTAGCTRRRGAARTLVALACAVLPVAAGCGKKGPPLAPLSRLPVAPVQVSAGRAGNEVTIRFVVPNANVSGVRPADIERVDVYAWTGPPLKPAEVFKLAKVVASVPVRPPPPPKDETDENAPPPPPRVGPGVDQGAPAELHETLAAEAFEQIEVPADKKAPPAAEPKVAPPDAAMVPPPLARRYVVVGVNGGGRRGNPAQPLAVPLWSPPPPPLAVRATTRETGIALTWTAPAIVRRPVMEHAPSPEPAAQAPKETPDVSAAKSPAPDDSGEQAEYADEDDDAGAPHEDASAPQEDAGTLQELPPVAEPAVPSAAAPTEDEHASAAEAEPAPSGLPSGLLPSGLLPARPKIPWPAVTIGYYVYEVAPPHPTRPAAPAKAGEPPPQPLPRRLTQVPIKKTEYSDARVEYGIERCYVVHTVETVGDLAVASDASEPACLETADVFAPAPPKSLAAVASEGAISLIWEANGEADLRGYIVLRGRAPGAPTERLTPEPIRESAFRDATVKPGTRYVYAVIAVDTATPPNASAPSNRVEETAR